MNSKPHRQNSDFQLRHFLVGDCKTPDGAYVLMYGQMIDMQGKVANAEAQRLRRKVKRLAAERIINDEGSDELAKMEAQADILEMEADEPTWEMNVTAAKQELETIKNLMLELHPKCRYADLDILAMSEAAQEEEWLLELKTRAENFIITQGTIPADHFNTMRCHPQFKTVLAPYVLKLNDAALAIAQGKVSPKTLMMELANQPLLLGNVEA